MPFSTMANITTRLPATQARAPFENHACGERIKGKYGKTLYTLYTLCGSPVSLEKQEYNETRNNMTATTTGELT